MRIIESPIRYNNGNVERPGRSSRDVTDAIWFLFCRQTICPHEGCDAQRYWCQLKIIMVTYGCWLGGWMDLLLWIILAIHCSFWVFFVLIIMWCVVRSSRAMCLGNMWNRFTLIFNIKCLSFGELFQLSLLSSHLMLFVDCWNSAIDENVDKTCGDLHIVLVYT